MTSREIKGKVKSFQKEFGIITASHEELLSAIEKQGYSVVEYNHIYNGEPVAALIEALKLTDNIIRSRGFTYADRNHRIVFVHEDLSPAEKRVVLAHEAGHIYCGHLSTCPIIGRDVQEEYDANEFAHYLLAQNSFTRVKVWRKSHAIVSTLILVALLLTAIGITTLTLINREKHYYGEYYITESGDKYHEKDCIFVKDKTNTRRITIEEFESGDYEACGICLPGN